MNNFDYGVIALEQEFFYGFCPYCKINNTRKEKETIFTQMCVCNECGRGFAILQKGTKTSDIGFPYWSKKTGLIDIYPKINEE